MSVISAIVPAPRQPGRVVIEVDGGSYATISVEAVGRLRLVVGGSIHGKQEQIAAEVAEGEVIRRALDMLALRARSTQELVRSLVRKGADAVLVQRVADRLTEQGLLNDSTFAESFARTKVLGARQSRRRVQQGLARKGVARAVADAAIDTVFGEEGVDQRAIVRDAAKKKLRGLAKLDPVVRKRRLYGYLARRGYEMDDIREVMSELREELSDSE